MRHSRIRRCSRLVRIIKGDHRFDRCIGFGERNVLRTLFGKHIIDARKALLGAPKSLLGRKSVFEQIFIAGNHVAVDFFLE